MHNATALQHFLTGQTNVFLKMFKWKDCVLWPNRNEQRRNQKACGCLMFFFQLTSEFNRSYLSTKKLTCYSFDNICCTLFYYIFILFDHAMENTFTQGLSLLLDYIVFCLVKRKWGTAPGYIPVWETGFRCPANNIFPQSNTCSPTYTSCRSSCSGHLKMARSGQTAGRGCGPPWPRPWTCCGCLCLGCWRSAGWVGRLCCGSWTGGPCTRRTPASWLLGCKMNRRSRNSSQNSHALSLSLAKTGELRGKTAGQG